MHEEKPPKLSTRCFHTPALPINRAALRLMRVSSAHSSKRSSTICSMGSRHISTSPTQSPSNSVFPTSRILLPAHLTRLSPAMIISNRLLSFPAPPWFLRTTTSAARFRPRRRISRCRSCLHSVSISPFLNATCPHHRLKSIEISSPIPDRPFLLID